MSVGFCGYFFVEEIVGDVVAFVEHVVHVYVSVRDGRGRAFEKKGASFRSGPCKPKSSVLVSSFIVSIGWLVLSMVHSIEDILDVTKLNLSFE